MSVRSLLTAFNSEACVWMIVGVKWGHLFQIGVCSRINFDCPIIGFNFEIWNYSRSWSSKAVGAPTLESTCTTFDLPNLLGNLRFKNQCARSIGYMGGEWWASIGGITRLSLIEVDLSTVVENFSRLRSRISLTPMRQVLSKLLLASPKCIFSRASRFRLHGNKAINSIIPTVFRGQN